MRLLGLALLVPLAACFSPNPSFISTTEGTGDTSTGAPGDSTDSSPTSTGTSSTSTSSDTTTTSTATSEPLTSTSEPLTSTSEPLTSTSEPLTGSSSGETTGPPDPPPNCLFDKADDEPIRYVRELDNGSQAVDECDNATETYTGPLTIQGGKLLMHESEDCNGGNPDLLIGEAWPALKDHTYPCVKARVYWTKVADECRIGALRVINLSEAMQNPIPPVILASLSYPSKPSADFQLWPTVIEPPVSACGCPGNLPGCCSPDAGQHALDLGEGEQVDSTQEVTFPRFGFTYRFKNIQSYVGPDCQQGPGVDVHVDWFLERN